MVIDQTVLAVVVNKLLAVKARNSSALCTDPERAPAVFEDAGDFGLRQAVFKRIGRKSFLLCKEDRAEKQAEK